MSRPSVKKFFGHIYYEKTEEELQQIIKEKMADVCRDATKHILKDWRPVQDNDPFDPNPTWLSCHDLVTIIGFLERYDSHEWGEVFLFKFRQYITELHNTGGWDQMFRDWDHDYRKKDHKVTSRRVEGDRNDTMFKNKKDYDEWFANQQKKDLLSDALGERGIGVDPGSGGRIRIVGKKGNGVGHA